jgi:hypothetical protein
VNPRGEWQPALLDEYRIAPWDMERFTLRELNDLFVYDRKVREARSGD